MAVMQPIYGAEEDNQIGRSDEGKNMTVLSTGQNTNLTADHMSILCFIIITIDDDNYPELYTLHAQKQQKKGQ